MVKKLIRWLMVGIRAGNAGWEAGLGAAISSGEGGEAAGAANSASVIDPDEFPNKTGGPAVCT